MSIIYSNIPYTHYMHISIIEDEKLLWENMLTKLVNHWYGVTLFSGYKDFMEGWHDRSHLYIIDIWLWDGNWFDIIDWLKKKKQSPAPILITSWYGDTDRIVYGLNIGADDYMVKPCIPDEFLARVNALARRNSKWKTSKTWSIISYKNMSFDPYTESVSISKRELNLSKKEILILEVFIRNPNTIVKRETLIDNAWWVSMDWCISDTVLNTALSRIRKKIGSGFEIKALYNFWYTLE